MNDPRFALDQLREMLDETLRVDTLAEKAALYSAARILLADLDIENKKTPRGLGENIDRAQWAFGAILGFDISNGHSAEQHLIWGRQAIKVLKEAFPLNN